MICCAVAVRIGGSCVFSRSVNLPKTKFWSEMEARRSFLVPKRSLVKFWVPRWVVIDLRPLLPPEAPE